MDNRSAGLEIVAGYGHALGATSDGEGTNFALFSSHAEKVEPCLFDVGGHLQVARLTLPEYTNKIWDGVTTKPVPFPRENREVRGRAREAAHPGRCGSRRMLPGHRD